MSVRKSKSRRHLIGLLPVFFIVTATLILGYKIWALDYDLDQAIQKENYHVEIVMEFEGHGSPVEVELALPATSSNQVVQDEAFSSDDMDFAIINSGGNRRGQWQSDNLSGTRHIGYTASIETHERKFAVDSTLPTEQQLPKSTLKYLLPDSMIQCGNPDIIGLADSLELSSDSTILFNLSTAFNYVTHTMKYVRYSGTTDALTAYHLGEASCGGKSRLLVALWRYIGMPSRLVGGKILSQGQTKATHIWTEVFIRGHWVPFCPTNDYFAVMPANYLILYYGEQPVISHTKDINFKFFFNVKKRLMAVAQKVSERPRGPLDILNVWTTFKRVAISLELLRIIIMLPFGVLAVVIFRNIIGLETFGTFMPALLAIGFRDTGLGIGIVLFLVILTFGSFVRLGLDRLQLLHTPRLAIILSSVVIFMLSITAVGVWLGKLDYARVALFPIVILTLTIERFSIITDESGIKQGVWIALQTLFVASVAYSIMSSRFLQSLVLSFPEVILIMAALFIYIGRYSGFRLAELIRFRHIIRKA